MAELKTSKNSGVFQVSRKSFAKFRTKGNLMILCHNTRLTALIKTLG